MSVPPQPCRAAIGNISMQAYGSRQTPLPTLSGGCMQAPAVKCAMASCSIATTSSERCFPPSSSTFSLSRSPRRLLSRPARPLFLLVPSPCCFIIFLVVLSFCSSLSLLTSQPNGYGQCCSLLCISPPSRLHCQHPIMEIAACSMCIAQLQLARLLCNAKRSRRHLERDIRSRTG